MIIDVNEKAIVKAMRKRTTRLEREGDYWSEEERRQLTSMFEEGYGLTEISNLSFFLLKNLAISGIPAYQTLIPYVLSLVFSLTG